MSFSTLTPETDDQYEKALKNVLMNKYLQFNEILISTSCRMPPVQLNPHK